MKGGLLETCNEMNSLCDEPLRFVHHHPGYLRVQAKILIGATEDSSALIAARNTAESTSGVLKWSHNSKTGSFVVKYRPGSLDVDTLAEQIAKNVGLRGVVMDIHSSAHRTELIHGLLDVVQDLNRLVFDMTGKRADLRELVPAALLANSFVAFALGENRGRLPSWDSSLYRSYRIFMQFHRREVRKREKLERKREKDQVRLQEKWTKAEEEGGAVLQ